MTRTISKIVRTGVLFGLAAVPVAAQNRAPVDQRAQDQRYQIGVVERVLEQAVEYGVARTRNRMQSVVPPPDMQLTSNARVRGFRQDGYGVFFDVEVPDFDYSWTFRLLDRSGLGLNSALQELRELVAKTRDPNAEQALKRIELQVVPVPVLGLTSLTPSDVPALPTGAGQTTGSAASASADTPPGTAPDPILGDPAEVYRAEIRVALIDAMLQYSRGLNLGPSEWFHVAAKRNDDRTRLAPVNTDDATLHIRVRGADLTAFLGGQISREEAEQRMEVKVF
jgi:hypothetical protein